MTTYPTLTNLGLNEMGFFRESCYRWYSENQSKINPIAIETQWWFSLSWCTFLNKSGHWFCSQIMYRRVLNRRDGKNNNGVDRRIVSKGFKWEIGEETRTELQCHMRLTILCLMFEKQFVSKRYYRLVTSKSFDLRYFGVYTINMIYTAYHTNK